MASADIINPQTFNRYVYVGNNPVNITDPTGLAWYQNNGFLHWFDGKPDKGWTPYNSLIGVVNGVNVALNVNSNGYAPITDITQTLRDFARAGATAVQLISSAAALGVGASGLAAAGVVIGAAGVVYLYTQYPAAAGRMKPTGCPAYIECMSVDDERMVTQLQMTNAGEKSSGTQAETSSDKATPNTEGNKPDTSVNSGGGKDARKSNPDRVASAKSKEQVARDDLATLKSKPNKTPADKKEIQRLENVIKKEQSRQKKSETHGRKDKGT